MYIIPLTHNHSLASSLTENYGGVLILPQITHFANGELKMQLTSQLPVNSAITIIASMSRTVNNLLIELFAITELLNRQGHRDITIFAPLLGYARQDSAMPHESHGMVIISRLIATMQFKQLITVDLHNYATLECLGPKVKHITLEMIMTKYSSYFAGYDHIIAPDAGCRHRLPKDLNAVTYLTKERRGSEIIMTMNARVGGKKCLIIDDIIDSGATMLRTLALLKVNGAREVTAYVTHYLGDEELLAELKKNGLTQLYTTNSTPLSPSLQKKIKILTLLALLDNIS